jgi:hypothetical protein
MKLKPKERFLVQLLPKAQKREMRYLESDCQGKVEEK